MVDEEKGAVSVHFAAEWESKATGRGWREGVVYVVEFEAGDEGVGRGEDRGERGREGGMRRKIKRLDLWADALSAWVCCGR